MSEPLNTQLRGAVDLSALIRRNESAEGGEAPTSPYVFEGTDANFAGFLELSSRVPVVVDLWADWCGPCKQLTPILLKLVAEYGGRLALVTVDVDANPQLAQAFQAQSIPTVAALLGGRPASLFVGALPEAQVREVFEQLLQLAAENGLTGTLGADGTEGAEAATSDGDGQTPPEPVEEPLPPHHAEAIAAIERGDLDAAKAEYRLAIAQDPNDDMAVAGLAQVNLLARLQQTSAQELRDAAAASPDDVDAQLAVADLDVAGGHVDDGFDRLLSVFPRLDTDGKGAVRERLVELFEVVGPSDPRVAKARARLAGLLY